MKNFHLGLLVLVLLAGIGLAISLHKENKAASEAVLYYSKASRLDSNTIFILNTNEDITSLYQPGDTVWVDNTDEMPRLCDECTFTEEVNNPSNLDYFKAVIR